MSSDNLKIQHVSDTAIWVAHYRATESERPDALFRDDLAQVLTGTRGREISDSFGRTSRYSRWSVIIRTVVIDELIQTLVGEGVDTVLNLGAGLDTRPYRLALPESLRWIEVDYPGIIEHKQRLLSSAKPGVKLERIALDLAQLDERRDLFARLNSTSRKLLVLTEGVIPYLSEEQVASLAEDLHTQSNFTYWIGEYFSPEVYRYFKTRQRMQQMKNAPFRFFPPDWFAFFRSRHWTPLEIRYLPEEAVKRGRAMPVPWWARLILLFTRKEHAAKYLKHMGYVVFSRMST